MPRGKKQIPVEEKIQEVKPEPKKRGRKPKSAVVAPVVEPVAAPAVEPEKAKRGRKKSVPEIQIAVAEEAKHDGVPDAYLADVCKLIGRNIRANRKLRKFSIDNLADYLELSSSYVGLLERGERCPSLKTLLKICDLFSIDFAELFSQGTGDVKSIHEKGSASSNNKHKSVMSLIHKLGDNELEFVITVLKSMKNMQKSSGDYIVQ